MPSTGYPAGGYYIYGIEVCQLLFQHLLMKLVSYKKVILSTADNANAEYSNFISSVVSENREQFLSFKILSVGSFLVEIFIFLTLKKDSPH